MIASVHNVVTIKFGSRNLDTFATELGVILDEERLRGNHLISSFTEYGYLFLIFVYKERSNQ